MVKGNSSSLKWMGAFTMVMAFLSQMLVVKDVNSVWSLV